MIGVLTLIVHRVYVQVIRRAYTRMAARDGTISIPPATRSPVDPLSDPLLHTTMHGVDDEPESADSMHHVVADSDATPMDALTDTAIAASLHRLAIFRLASFLISLIAIPFQILQGIHLYTHAHDTRLSDIDDATWRTNNTTFFVIQAGSLAVGAWYCW